VGFRLETTETGTVESKTITCCHCNRLRVLKFGAQVLMCRKCFKPVCERQACNTRCRPTEKGMELLEKRLREQQSRDGMLKSILGG
jgi:hypothetical protein